MWDFPVWIILHAMSDQVIVAMLLRAEDPKRYLIIKLMLWVLSNLCFSALYLFFSFLRSLGNYSTSHFNSLTCKSQVCTAYNFLLVIVTNLLLLLGLPPLSFSSSPLIPSHPHSEIRKVQVHSGRNWLLYYADQHKLRDRRSSIVKDLHR